MTAINKDHRQFAADWLMAQLHSEPMWSEKAVQLLEHTRRVQPEATRKAIGDLLKRGEIRVAEEYKDVNTDYWLLQLNRLPSLDELRKEHNSIRKQLKQGASGADKLRARRTELSRIYRQHYREQQRGLGPGRKKALTSTA